VKDRRRRGQITQRGRIGQITAAGDLEARPRGASKERRPVLTREVVLDRQAMLAPDRRHQCRVVELEQLGDPLPDRVEMSREPLEQPRPARTVRARTRAHPMPAAS
jgi:hypothetical protein